MARLAPDALDLIVRTMLGEADNSPEGFQAVANVIKNRVDSGAWGANTKLGPVINAPKQFTVWNPGSKNGDRVRGISTSDPNYQRAAQVAQQVFAGQLGDNTGGATHYYAPKLMPNGQAPDWASGQAGRQIGTQIFYRLPLTAANTGGTAVISPSTVGTSAPAANSSIGASEAGFAYGGNSPQDQGVDMRHLEPVFRARIDQLRADAAAAGIPTHITDGYRDNVSQGKDYAALGARHLAAAPGTSYHQFGRAVDLVADNPAQQQALIALADQPERGITAGAHFATPDRVHFQASEGKTAPLEATPGTTPAPVDDPFTPKPAGQGGIGSEGHLPLSTAPPGTPPAVSTIVGGAHPEQTGQQQQSAAPGAERFSMLQGMTAGTSHNPELYTAANLGALFGGGTPATPPAAAPAAAAPSTQPVTAPPPTPAPAPAAPTAPPNAPVNEKPGSILSSILPNWGATTEGYDPDKHPSLTPDAHMPGGLGSHPATTPGQPTMGFPAMQNPFGAPPTSPDQTSMLPGSMLSSAQNLIRLLFPSIG